MAKPSRDPVSGALAEYYDAACQQRTPTARVYHTFVAIVMFFVPIIVIIDCYAVICVCLLVRKSPVSGAASDSHSRAKRKVVRMLVAVVVAFIACWAPLHIMELRDTWRDDNDEQSPHMVTVRYVVLYVAYLNSAVNPVLYAGFNENFRRGFKEVFTNGCLPFLKKRKIFPASLRSQSGGGSQMVQRANRANAAEPKPRQHTRLEKLQPRLNNTETTPASPGDEPCHRPNMATIQGSEGAGDRQPVILDPSRLHVGNGAEGDP
ncbi:pyroglutamylated RFamide peptide receptor-like isoform X3 [Pomacea canaliculata]|uniref:pyroglutamylated RFamide peptide receptor-like isoform X3 n=1 Tax=Pomacea canaliculata TaxID=400727 RepID=UPI000D739CC0|nr:pyroglutamylated RFamide peptide receptor-like isoform X3 [Pomacea canaliculata]XP_025082987.1 pyroglutamylated RFamide peptide receptor-like isoform X3 [Pomacea canaliculata]XP_025082995.1 pyroglutamylated RFamide peptide receptor-like isoform X3 [Pomacea canaliculata]